MKNPDAYHCPSCNTVRIDQAGGIGELTLDHNPSVANHWSTTGHDCSHDERSLWYNGSGSNGAILEAMCRSCNSRKGKGDENPEPTSYKVGRRFRGKNEGQAP